MPTKTKAFSARGGRKELAQSLFPVGDIEKPEVRRIAENWA